MSDEPESLILRMLRDMRAEMGDMRSEMATKSDLHSLHADVASDIANLQAELGKTRKELREQVVGLRRGVMEYHSSVVGHGILISDLEARVRRVEQHLNLPSMEPN